MMPGAMLAITYGCCRAAAKRQGQGMQSSVLNRVPLTAIRVWWSALILGGILTPALGNRIGATTVS
jgi:hypothetical protein